jgi:hypothetical protein
MRGGGGEEEEEETRERPETPHTGESLTHERQPYSMCY